MGAHCKHSCFLFHPASPQTPPPLHASPLRRQLLGFTGRRAGSLQQQGSLEPLAAAAVAAVAAGADGPAAAAAADPAPAGGPPRNAPVLQHAPANLG